LSGKGRIVAIEGIDAVGKHTQSLLLEAWLRERGTKVSSLSFPDYETPIGREIKAFLAGKRSFPAEVRHMLFAANRWEKVPLIDECLADSEVVIVNRYTESNLAYGLANGLPLRWLLSLEQGIPKTDLVIVLVAPTERVRSRRPGPKDSYEKDQGLQDRVQSFYEKLAHRFGWVTLDGSLPVDEVHRSIAEVVKGKLRVPPRAKP
jgi:dTMP kinase